MGVDNAIEGNARVTRCEKFFAIAPPAMASKVVVYAVSDPPIKLMEWMRAEWNPGLGHELDALMQEHHEDSGQADSKFTVSFVDDDDKPMRTKTFTARTRPKDIGMDASGVAAVLDGSTQASHMLTQQVTLALARMFLTAQQSQIQAFITITERLTDRLIAVDDSREKTKEEYHSIRELLAEKIAAGNEGDKLTPAQEQFFEVLKMAVPDLMKRFGMGGG